MKPLLFLLAFLTAACSSGTDDPAPPMVSGFAFNESGTLFTLTGSGFVEPLDVVIMDQFGLTLAVAAATTNGDGTAATGEAPAFPAPVAKMTMTIGIRNGDGRAAIPMTANLDVPCRTEDGADNNIANPAFGMAGTTLSRLAPAEYADGVSELAGATRPNPRAISNAVFEQAGSTSNASGATDMFWQWGQFLDHDIDLTPGADPVETAKVAVPAGDPHFDPLSTGAVEIGFDRSTYAIGSQPRQQLNVITAFIDASNVYGSSKARADALRTLDGTGRLKTSPDNLLPFNTAGLENAGGTSPSLFLAGDVRANEQTGLTCMHTLFLREHNRLADEIRATHPGMDGDAVYQSARRIVGAQLQVITYREFLPMLLGPGALAPYTGYKPGTDAGIANLFSTAAYRFGHSLISARILRLDAAGNEIAEGHLALRDAFFDPSRITDEGGIEPVLRGLSAHVCQALDGKMVDDLRNFLFGPPGAGGFDLATLNIQRCRDHGLPNYNDARAAVGLARRNSIADISSDPETRARLLSIYTDIDNVDAWVAGLAEDRAPGALVGEFFFMVLKEQFERLRDGDRFWYERCFGGDLLREIEATRLSDIIKRNTTIGAELPANVFRALPGN